MEASRWKASTLATIIVAVGKPARWLPLLRWQSQHAGCHLPLPAAQMLTTLSWAVTAWPPVGVWEARALLRSSPLTDHCFETLLAWLPQHFLCSFPLAFSGEIHCSRARCFPLTSSSHAHDDELGRHRLAAGGGLGGLRATSFISSDRSLLRDTSGAPASALFCPRSGSFFSVSFSWRCARCFSPYQQPKCSRR